jgi:hypothetical protein
VGTSSAASTQFRLQDQVWSRPSRWCMRLRASSSPDGYGSVSACSPPSGRLRPPFRSMDWSRRSLAGRERGFCGVDFFVEGVIIDSAGCSGGCGDRERLFVGALRRAERLGDRLNAHVAAADGPLVVLLGEQRADQADDRGPVGEDADDVGAAADLAVQPLERVVRPQLPPVLLRCAVKARISGPASSSSAAASGKRPSS